MSELQVDTIAGSGGTTVTIKTGHTLTLVADMDAGTAKITNMGDPTSAQDAATKAYVDTQLLTLDTIGELTDVTITSVTDNEVLAYDSTSSEWINQTASEAGLATSGDLASYALSSDLTTHTSDTTNPHSVTASQVGLSSTDDLTEGVTNLYYSNAQVDSYLSGGNGVSYSSGTIAVDITGATDGTAISVDTANDEILLYDTDATAVKKVKVNQIATPSDINPFLLIGA